VPAMRNKIKNGNSMPSETQMVSKAGIAPKKRRATSVRWGAWIRLVNRRHIASSGLPCKCKVIESIFFLDRQCTIAIIRLILFERPFLVYFSSQNAWRKSGVIVCW
jgi:hypothetical protein